MRASYCPRCLSEYTSSVSSPVYQSGPRHDVEALHYCHKCRKEFVVQYTESGTATWSDKFEVRGDS